MSLTITVDYKGQTYSRTIADAKLAALLNDLGDEGDIDDPNDIVGWIFAGPQTGKINSTGKRIMRDEIIRLRNDPEVTEIPGTPNELIASAIQAPGYQNKSHRDAIAQVQDATDCKVSAENSKVTMEDALALAEAKLASLQKQEAPVDKITAVENTIAEVNCAITLLDENIVKADADIVTANAKLAEKITEAAAKVEEAKTW